MALAYSNPSSSRTSDDIELPRHDGPFEPRALQDEEQIDPWEEGLGTFDVFALIVNKMIGTGIYTAPTTVYLMTGSKSLTLGLFGVGFLYCLMSTAIYLQYAAVLPYNGGELVYLDEITAHVTPTSTDALVVPVAQTHNEELNGNLERQATDSRNSTTSRITNTASNGLWARFVHWRRKLMGDGLLAFIIYSIMFIVFFNSATNSMQFGRMVLLCINADQGVDNAIVDVNNDLMRYIGVTILTIICLTQFFSPSFGRRLNKFLAVVKIGFLLGLAIVGLTALSRDIKDGKGHDTTQSSDWSKWNERKVVSKVSFAKALLIVLFSFEGWENATFVSSFLLPLGLP
ncbi:High-affinity methionine permease [Fusarium acuminatum]|uniref:High-affinity methionine permease n=1 Tax=Fusarium acuminatum TaxID=5515 RepID=A0ABZ2X5A2_9HYPO